MMRISCHAGSEIAGAAPDRDESPGTGTCPNHPAYPGYDEISMNQPRFPGHKILNEE